MSWFVAGPTISSPPVAVSRANTPAASAMTVASEHGSALSTLLASRTIRDGSSASDISVIIPSITARPSIFSARSLRERISHWSTRSTGESNRTYELPQYCEMRGRISGL